MPPRRSLIYSRKSVGPRIEPCRTLALTGYSCENFPSRTTRTCLLLRKNITSTCEDGQRDKPCRNPCATARLTLDLLEAI